MSVKAKKKTLIIAAALAVLLVLMAAGAFYLVKSGMLYGFTERLSRFFGPKLTLSLLEKDSIELCEITIGEMKNDSRFAFDDSLMLVNSKHLLEASYSPDITEYKDTDVLMNSCIISAYAELSQSVTEKFGEKLYVRSSYRTAQEQAAELESADEETVAAVGASEHQTGLALDVYAAYFAGDGFLNSPIGRYVNSKCDDFGFIIRYPQGKESVTGIRFEPWHIRYVGFPHSRVISTMGLTLEEYIAKLSEGEFYSADGYIITRQKKGASYLIPVNTESAVVSEDNMGNVVITCLMKGDTIKGD